MSSEYSKVRVGKLVLKGEKKSHKKHKSKKRKHENDGGSTGDIAISDKQKYGGWWKVSKFSEISGSIAIQVGDLPVFARALDQGIFTLGAPHDEGSGPDPEEILSAVPAGEQHVSFKSGYGKYLGVDGKGMVTGVADAIGPRERWEPIFEEGKTALLASNECFLSVDDDDNIVAKSLKAGQDEMITVRSNSIRAHEKQDEIPEAEKGKLKDVEMNYIKMFQKFQDKRVKVCGDGRAELRDAKEEGRLHESLLDRRSKMKADRYCK